MATRVTIDVGLTSQAIRWRRRTLRSAESLGEDLGFAGLYVGPRTGEDARTHGQKEDYVLRRVLAAWRAAGRITFPIEVTAQEISPDFLLSGPADAVLGLEITEAGAEDYQAWLTRAETGADTAVADPFDISTNRTVDEIARAISRKNAKYEKGLYAAVAVCDLAVFDNTHSGAFLDKVDIVGRLRRRNDLRGGFRAVHVVFDERVIVDLFGAALDVDVSRAYEVDYLAWLDDQVSNLRSGAGDTIDWHNVAEELKDVGSSLRRALGSHLRVLLLHLLKFEFQPRKRSRSWRASITNARQEIADLLIENPGLRPEFRKLIAEQYPRVRRLARDETGLPIETFPEQCPYDPKALLDAEFPPGGSGQADRG